MISAKWLIFYEQVQLTSRQNEVIGLTFASTEDHMRSVPP